MNPSKDRSQGVLASLSWLDIEDTGDDMERKEDENLFPGVQTFVSWTGCWVQENWLWDCYWTTSNRWRLHTSCSLIWLQWDLWITLLSGIGIFICCCTRNRTGCCDTSCTWTSNSTSFSMWVSKRRGWRKLLFLNRYDLSFERHFESENNCQSECSEHDRECNCQDSSVVPSIEVFGVSAVIVQEREVPCRS